MSKHIDLTPYLDYFDVLQKLTQQGDLQIRQDYEVKAHECYITQPALFAISDGDAPRMMLLDGSVEATLRRLRTYAGWLSTEGMAYLRQPFRVHVVQSEAPYDLIWTFILRKRKYRRWKDTLETIVYPKKSETDE